MSDDTRTRSEAISFFHGKVKDYPAWRYDIRMYATGKDMLDVLDNVDNPFKRVRRLAEETVPKTAADRDVFDDSTVDTKVLSRETIPQYAKRKEEWREDAMKLFAAIAKSAKGTVKQLLMPVPTGDVQGQLDALDPVYGNVSKASRFQLLMSFILLAADSAQDLEKYIAQWGELRRQMADLQPPEKFSVSAETCLFLNGLQGCEEFAPMLSSCLTSTAEDTDVETTIAQTRNYFKSVGNAGTASAMRTDARADGRGRGGRGGGRSRGRGGRGGDERTCSNCNKPGHLWRKCGKELKPELQRVLDRSDSETSAKASKAKRFKVNAVKTAKAMAVFKKAAADSLKERGIHLLLLDTAANRHCMVHKSLLTDTKECNVPIVVAEGTEVSAQTKGTLDGIFCSADGDEVPGEFADALHTPTFGSSLLAGMRIVKAGGVVHLEKGNCYFSPGADRDLKIKVEIKNDDFVVQVRDPTHAKARGVGTKRGHDECDDEVVNGPHDTESESEESA
jgi:hypothetical protein